MKQNAVNRQLAQEIINKEKWWDILSRLIDVLRVNIFIVDGRGGILLPPEEGKYGGALLADVSLGFNLLKNTSVNIEQFEAENNYFEYQGPYHLYCFSLPILIQKDKLVAYMVIGPVILNRAHDRSQYQKLAEERGVEVERLIDQINDIRVVSHVMMNSILDLLAEIIKDQVERIEQSRKHFTINPDSEEISKRFNDVANEIYSTVRLDELLATLLDAALKMTNTECGSIMMYDKEQDRFSIKASKGLNLSRIEEVKTKLGEGLAGMAAQKNQTYIIEGQVSDDNKIKSCLKRPDIKQSLIMPIVEKNRILGVLNLHSKTEESRIKENLENLQYLTRLLSSTI